MTQTVQVLSQADKDCKTKKDSNKRKRVVAPNTSSESSCDRFRESWEHIKEEIDSSIQKQERHIVHSIHQIVEKTFDATLLPVVSVVSEASDNIFPHLIQQLVDYPQKVDSHICHIVTKLRPTDFLSLSLVVRAVVEQCILDESFKDSPGFNPDSCARMNPDSVGPPADFLLQWYEDLRKNEYAVSIIILIEEIYSISDAVLTKFIQWISVLREQQVKFCLVTFANDDLALFKAKVESQGKISIDVFPVYDSTVRDAYIQVLEEVFVFNTPPFEISPQVLTFLRDKALQDRLPVTEFLRLLKLVCFDYFSSSSLICSNDWLLAKHGIHSMEEFNDHMQRVSKERNVSHGLMEWISKNVLAACSISTSPLDLYQAAINGALSKEKTIQSITSALSTHISVSKLSQVLEKWWSSLEPYLKDSEWRNEIENSFLKLIQASSKKSSNDIESNEGSSGNKSCSNAKWNAAKRRRQMLQALKSRQNEESHALYSDTVQVLQTLVNFIDRAFSHPLTQLVTYSSFSHLLQISGYNTLCRKHWLSKNNDCFECCKYRECILSSLPRGKRRICPTEWFETSLQLWKERNKKTDDPSNSEKEQLLSEFWKGIMELHYCGAIRLSKKNQLLIERSIFY